MIYNFTNAISRIHFAICEVRRDNSNPEIFFYLGFLSETFTGQQSKGEAISLTPLYHFYPLHRHLEVNQEITAESSPHDIAKFLPVIVS